MKSRKIKYALWLTAMHAYAVLFTGPAIWRAFTSGAISMAVFSAFAFTGLTNVWIFGVIALVIARLAMTR